MSGRKFKPPFAIGQMVQSNEADQIFVVSAIQWSGGNDYLVRCSWLTATGRADLWLEAWRVMDAEVGHA